MVDHAGLPSDHDPFADRRTPRDADLGHDDAVFSHGHVVGDLDQVVDFGALPDVGGSERGPVDGDVGADFDVIFYDDDSPLRNLAMAAFVLNVPESITPDDRSGVDNDPSADPASVQNTRVRIQHGVVTDRDLVSQKDSRIDRGPISDGRAMADRDEWSNGHVPPQAYVRAFCDVLCDPRGRGCVREKSGDYPDKIKLRLRGDELGAVQIRKILRDDESRGLRSYGFVHRAMIGQERQVARRCLLETVDARNTKIRRAMKLGIDGAGLVRLPDSRQVFLESWLLLLGFGKPRAVFLNTALSRKC